MFARITLALTLLALGAMPVAGQQAPKPAKPPVVVAPAPVPSPVVMPDAVAIEEHARQAAETARLIGMSVAVPPLDQFAVRAYEEALLGQSSAGVAAQDVQRKAEQIREQARLTYMVSGSSYEKGVSLLDRGRYDEAIAAFDGVIKANKEKVEGAHYWKAYAQNRLGQRAEALATLDAMLKAYPTGRWVSDARALQVEVKQASGQPVSPDQSTDDEIKLIAVGSLVRQDPEKAIPVVEKMLAGAASPRLKERALFVLAQTSSPKAKAMLLDIAKGKGNPDLQLKAIDYFGTFASADADAIKQLVEIYRSVTDVDVKKRVIRSLAMQGRSFAFGGVYVGGASTTGAVFSGTSAPVVVRAPNLEFDYQERGSGRSVQADERTKAREARAAEARAALWQIYQSESSVDLKREILRSSAMGGDPTKLMEVLRTERDSDLRQSGIRSLGVSKDPKVADFLLTVYRSEKDQDVRRSVIDALLMQQNATVLVQLARQESDPSLRKALVERLSTMKSKEATDYMMELLRK